MSYAERVTRHPSTSVPARLFDCLWRQAARNARCPDAPGLEGVALVTGGNRGIGLATSRGLAVRGAEVIAAARGEDAGKRAMEALCAETGRPAHFLPLDLADLAALPRTLDRLEGVLRGRRLAVLVANAGLWPGRHRLSAQGHELAFATNVLGHHALLRGLLERGCLAQDARVVFVTGDIYILVDDCTPDFHYTGGGQPAYCRSKLGNLWQVHELARRHPGLRVYAVHPGVVASGLGGRRAGPVEALRRALTLTPEQGAQTTLYCVTQEGLPSGSYYHNTLGRMDLHPDDPGANTAGAARLFERLEALAS